MTPLTPEEVDALPDKLKRRYWAGSIGEGYEGLSAVTLKQAMADCRAWLDMTRTLKPGDRVTLTTGEKNVEVVVVRRDGFDPGDGQDRWPGQYVTIRDGGDLFLVSMQRVERIVSRETGGEHAGGDCNRRDPVVGGGSADRVRRQGDLFAP